MKHMERLGRFYDPEEILPHVATGARIKLEGKSLKVSSKRLKCFKRSLICVSCGLKGSRFWVEKPKKGYGWHLNLYAVDSLGQEVLMTQDHILAKADGGKDSLDNLQTMCAPCNNHKGSKANEEHNLKHMSEKTKRKRAEKEKQLKREVRLKKVRHLFVPLFELIGKKC